jgi:hypothetical protein
MNQEGIYYHIERHGNGPLYCITLWAVLAVKLAATAYQPVWEGCGAADQLAMKTHLPLHCRSASIGGGDNNYDQLVLNRI